MPFGLNAIFTCLKVKSNVPNKVFERNNLPVYLLCCCCYRWEWGQGSPHHHITRLWQTVTDRGLLLLQHTTIICSLVLITCNVVHSLLISALNWWSVFFEFIYNYEVIPNIYHITLYLLVGCLFCKILQFHLKCNKPKNGHSIKEIEWQLMNVPVSFLEPKHNGIKNRKNQLTYGMLYQISVESNGVC